MRPFPFLAFSVGFTTAVPTLNRVYQSQTQDLTITSHPETPVPPPSISSSFCDNGLLSDEVYIITNPSGVCGTDALEPCTQSALKVEGLCSDTCVHGVDSTSSDPARMYGLSHPRPNGGFFVLYNGTRCESDTIYLRYPAQRVGTGPVRYVQTMQRGRMEVSPFMSFRYVRSRI
ncbi:hypothetical protein diail_11289 [Diaporthe ilicicola]|nr:hypothetical protein diail_11289 [Diaporthe ilicicola]